ncbi:hypothetical protein G7Z17_g3235 [Cylindrodendrum hubeiense]|uniref:Uncharacterized protein n=1 Tax=Cylindrodendrum hubeiense TaxID=595255 RepID=A0A9P5HB88_9HYPO|nr:hypothetical protein G7Z17_g3235 [Cylindrodendrum hubeiense]
MAQRYISNNLPAQMLGSAPGEILPYTLELVLKYAPPLPAYTERHLGGLFTGYTGLAYLFLQLSAMHPDLQVCGHNLIYWTNQYLAGDRGLLVLEGKCGISSEKLSFEADDPFPSEICHGRAGALYLLRMVKHWVPEYAPLIESPLLCLTERIMNTDDDGRGNWEWHGRRYFGAAHGDIGIITQLALSNPSLAPQLSSRIEKLLELQTPDGNWPDGARSLKEGRTPSLVQWCHGAPGFIYSLLSLRPYFPLLHEQIDTAIEKGQELIWRHGLLTKEPSLCHGIFGNALVLPRGPRREHFLALATANAVDKVKRHDPQLFEPAAYGKKSAVLLNYLPSAAWTWAVCEQEAPGLIMYNDL